MQLISGFHLGHPTDYDFCSILGLVLLLSLKQPMELNDTFFLRMLSPFSRLFFSFSDDVTITVPWTCTFWGYLRMSPVPSCTSGMLAVLLKVCFWSPGSRLAGNFSPRILVDFCWVLFPFESGHLYGCSHHIFAVWFYFLPCCICWKFMQLVRNQFE